MSAATLPGAVRHSPPEITDADYPGRDAQNGHSQQHGDHEHGPERKANTPRTRPHFGRTQDREDDEAGEEDDTMSYDAPSTLTPISRLLSEGGADSGRSSGEMDPGDGELVLLRSTSNGDSTSRLSFSSAVSSYSGPSSSGARQPRVPLVQEPPLGDRSTATPSRASLSPTPSSASQETPDVEQGPAPRGNSFLSTPLAAERGRMNSPRLSRASGHMMAGVKKLGKSIPFLGRAKKREDDDLDRDSPELDASLEASRVGSPLEGPASPGLATDGGYNEDDEGDTSSLGPEVEKKARRRRFLSRKPESSIRSMSSVDEGKLHTRTWHAPDPIESDDPATEDESSDPDDYEDSHFRRERFTQLMEDIKEKKEMTEQKLRNVTGDDDVSTPRRSKQKKVQKYQRKIEKYNTQISDYRSKLNAHERKGSVTGGTGLETGVNALARAKDAGAAIANHMRKQIFHFGDRKADDYLSRHSSDTSGGAVGDRVAPDFREQLSKTLSRKRFSTKSPTSPGRAERDPLQSVAEKDTKAAPTPPQDLRPKKDLKPSRSAKDSRRPQDTQASAADSCDSERSASSLFQSLTAFSDRVRGSTRLGTGQPDRAVQLQDSKGAVDVQELLEACDALRQEECERLSRSVESLRRIIEAAEKNRRSLHNEIAGLTKELALKSSYIEDLQVKIRAKDEQLDQQLSERYEQFVQRLVASQNEISTLRGQLSDVNASVDAINEQARENEDICSEAVAKVRDIELLHEAKKDVMGRLNEIGSRFMDHAFRVSTIDNQHRFVAGVLALLIVLLVVKGMYRWVFVPAVTPHLGL